MLCKHIFILVSLVRKKKDIFGNFIWIIRPFRGNNMSLFFSLSPKDSDIIYVGHCSLTEQKTRARCALASS